MSITQKLGSYLGSTKNFVGLGLATVGVGAYALDITGTYGLGVAALLYAVGAIAIPGRKKFNINLDERDSVEIEKLQQDLDELRRMVRKTASRIPSASREQLDSIFSNVSDVLGRADRLVSSPEQMFIVSRTIRDYIPSTLSAYLSLPAAYVFKSQNGTRRTAQDELYAQLSMLSGKLDEVSDSLYRGDADLLISQGKFLEQKFHTSELDNT